MTNHDKDLENYLNGDSELSKLYAGSDLDSNNSDLADTDFPDSNLPDSNLPGMDLDNSILAAAKREVGAGPQKNTKKYSPFSNNYFIPFSTAASIVIVVFVVSLFPEPQKIEFEQVSDVNLSRNSEPTPQSSPNSTLAQVTQSSISNSTISNSSSSNNSDTDMSMELQSAIPEIKFKESKQKENRRDIATRSITEKSSIANKTKSKRVQTKDRRLRKNSIPSVKTSDIKESTAALELNSESNESNSVNDNLTQAMSIITSDENISEDYAHDYIGVEEQSNEQEYSRVHPASSNSINEAEYKTELADAISLKKLSRTSKTVLNQDLIYDEITWKNLPATEWRTRIKALYQSKIANNNKNDISAEDSRELKEIIKHYNNKFPSSKIDIQDIINGK